MKVIPFILSIAIILHFNLTKDIESKKIILHAIQVLENLTRSPLTKKLIKEPVLTPSLSLIDKSEIKSVVDTSKPVKGTIFKPFEGVVKLRMEMKAMFEQLSENPKNESSAVNKEAEKQIKALNRKIEELKVQIRGLEKRNNKLKSDLVEAEVPKEDPKMKAMIATIENQNAQLKENNDKLKQQANEFKQQIDELRVIINQADDREKSLVEKLEALQRSHEDLKEEYEYLAKLKDQLKKEKDRLVTEITNNGTDADNLLGDTFRKMYFEQQNSKCIH